LQVALILIHDVVTSDGKPKHDADARAAMREKGVVLFDSYLEGAPAPELAAQGLLSVLLL
jgi:hypothetical protein